MEEQNFKRKELYDLVWSQSLLALSKKFNISDVGLRKICKNLEIPLPKAGYWAKLQAGKKVKKEPLPEREEDKQVITLKARAEGDPNNGFPYSPYYALQKEIKEDKRLNLKVPERLSNPDILVTKAKQSLAEKHKSWKFEGMIHTTGENLDIRVSPQNVERSLRFMDAFIKISRGRGHDILVANGGTYLVVKEQRIKVSCREISKKIVVKEKYGDRTQYHPTGLLGFKSEGYSYGEWKDGKKKIEEQIPAILAKIELSIQGLLQIWEESRKREELRKEREHLERELEERQEKELSNFKLILQNANRLHQANIIRTYAMSVEENAKSKKLFTDEIRGWVEWAKKKADWYDPLIESEDDMLANVDRNTLVLKKKQTNYS
jgi:hypothetical protein